MIGELKNYPSKSLKPILTLKFLFDSKISDVIHSGLCPVQVCF